MRVRARAKRVRVRVRVRVSVPPTLLLSQKPGAPSWCRWRLQRMAAAASLTMSARASPVPAAMPASSKASYSHSSEGSGPHRALLPPVRRVRARARPRAK